MKESIYRKYAKLLVHYSLYLKKGERLLIVSTPLAAPLIREVYREALSIGVFVDTDITLDGMSEVFYKTASDEHLDFVSPVKRFQADYYDARLHIRASYNLKELQSIDMSKINRYNTAFKDVMDIYRGRELKGEFKWGLCEFPVQASAQECGMSLSEYEDFIFNACHLYADDPASKWQEVSDFQQRIVDYLNKKENIHYKSDDVDLKFNTKGRTWINSDGKRNMPSGEVYTSPVEDSVEGKIKFTYPLIYSGQEIKNIEFEVKKGEIVKWDAESGKETLDKIFELPGARYFGEAAVGTNEGIQRPTKNILFDEKIGGTVHMAIGNSYQTAGGKNKSPIHLDIIADMRKNGAIYADGELIYKEGKFII